MQDKTFSTSLVAIACLATINLVSMPPGFSCRQANGEDVESIVALVNRAYRPATTMKGWTHESDLIAGVRTTSAQILALLSQSPTILVLQNDAIVVACVHVSLVGSSCHIGMLATEPSLQTQGVGKLMLACAEAFAKSQFDAAVVDISVLSERHALISFYERRGYERIGGMVPYPLKAGVGVPLHDGMHVISMRKSIGDNCNDDV